MTRLHRIVWILAFGGLVACSEPDSTVTGSTGDAAYKVTLEARKNHLKRQEKIPVWVSVERVNGPPVVTSRDTITFVANFGSVDPSRITFGFVGTSDTLYTTGATSTYGQWVTFTLTAFPPDDAQAELHALYKDLDAILKFRIVDDD